MRGPLSLEDPLDIDDARLASRRLSEQRRTAEENFEQQAVKAADAEQKYRMAFARSFVGLGEGMTAAQKEAEARSKCSDEARDRDIQAALLKVMQERLRGLEGERSMLKSLIDWSSRMAERPAPDGQVFGARRAA
jgi:hypothetical protein